MECPYAQECFNYLKTLNMSPFLLNHKFDRCFCPRCFKSSGIAQFERERNIDRYHPEAGGKECVACGRTWDMAGKGTNGPAIFPAACKDEESAGDVHKLREIGIYLPLFR